MNPLQFQYVQILNRYASSLEIHSKFHARSHRFVAMLLALTLLKQC